ncbi:phospholipase [Curvibacter sp. HBC61]|uniref:Phospholipase n=1 Tax=Curvibacter cyanobacteriorum TaxID=3026422 RepID=A0ABT5MSQ3_9BURK|nr:phospholipase [Curvibacter sp. HBC61]MDD0837078.1 phospholipase [Curvibacter sp. HBC61]
MSEALDLNTLGLKALYRPAAAGTAQPWLLVLMHGVGSHEADLFALAPWVPPNFHLLSLRAPFPLGPQSFAWFQFDVLPNGQRQIQADQEAHSRAQLAEVLAQAAHQLQLPAERVVVGGFSQGGIMGLSLLLTRPQDLRAALVMHSRLLPEAVALQAPAESLAGRSLWLSYGTEDEVLPPSHTQAIVNHVRALPIDLQGAGFPGGHTLSRPELDAVSGWLAALSQAPA